MMSNFQVNNNNKIEGLKDERKLIIGLASLTLVKPVIGMLGLMNFIRVPALGMRFNIIISLIWIIAVVYTRVQKPMKTLFYTGVTSGIFTVIFGGVFSILFSGRLQGPLVNPFAFVSIMTTSAVLGLISGIIASVFTKASK